MDEGNGGHAFLTLIDRFDDTISLYDGSSAEAGAAVDIELTENGRCSVVSLSPAAIDELVAALQAFSAGRPQPSPEPPTLLETFRRGFAFAVADAIEAREKDSPDWHTAWPTA